MLASEREFIVITHFKLPDDFCSKNSIDSFYLDSSGTNVLLAKIARC